MKAIGSSEPRLRFKDEQGKDYPLWQYSPFRSIATLVKTPSKGNGLEIDDRCVELEGLSQGSGRLIRTFKSTHYKGKKHKFEVGDVLFGKLRPYLRKFWYAKFNGLCSTEIWIFRSINVPSKFLFQLIQTRKFGNVASVQTGTRMPRSDWSVVSYSQFGIPQATQEQHKIADFLSAVDEKIEQLERKRELLEHYKKGLMQKLFSQEWRFKDDNGNKFPEWQTKCLVDLGIVITGKTPSTTNKALWGGELLFITPTDIDDRSKYQYKTARNIKPSKGVSILPSHSIVYSCIASIGKITMTVRPSTTNQQINSIIPHESISSNFVYYLLVWNTPRIKATRACNTLPIINKTEFQNIIVNVPNSSEQRKIADFLSAVDKKIEHLNNQIELSSTFKQGLLQQLFV